MMDKYQILKKYFGYSSFRGGQEEAIDSILSGRDILGIMPTGAGKSVCYQVPAMMMSGICVVISPLISLMKDQVANLNLTGISSCFINSSQSFEEQQEIFSGIRQGSYKVVYVAPERLNTSSFVNLCQSVHISMIAIDEAHCVSQWGHDFRPSYLGILDFINILPVRPIIGAFTATATNRVKDDICNILRLNNPCVITTGFDRPNLFFSVINPNNRFSALLKILKKHDDECGIIYCATRKNVEKVAERLIENGFSAAPYHAGLSEEEKKQNQEDFIYDKIKIIVATNAFGMGIDKSNVTFIVHYNIPKDIESYYQEAGRAGRDGSRADCYLLYSSQDYHLNLFILKKSYTEGNCTQEVLESNIKKLQKMTNYATTNSCLRHYILEYFGDSSSSYCGKCSNCLKKFKDFDATIQSQKILSCVYRVGQRKKYVGKTTLIKILMGSKNEKIISRNLDTISTFGIMKDEPQERINQICDELIHEDYIGVTEGKFPLLYLKEKSAEVLRGKKKIIMKLPEIDDKKLVYHEESDSLTSEEKDLFAVLRKVRLEFAEEEKVPVYIIFTNAALEDMCRKMPVTMEEFKKVSSVGKVRSEKYGEAFIKAIADFKAGQKTLTK